MMKVLDLFCGAGGASAGYVAAGFDVLGVDIEPQPDYPFTFVQADALDFLRSLIASGGVGQFDLIHASPPCQRYSITRFMATGDHPDLIDDVRDLLTMTAVPYVIENTPGAPLINPLTLCGTMFGLRTIRHRLFECSPTIWFPPAMCRHDGKATSTRNTQGVTNGFHNGFDFITVCGNSYLADDGRVAMNIDWMPKRGLSQAIPPAYTEWIGLQMMKLIQETQ